MKVGIKDVASQETNIKVYTAGSELTIDGISNLNVDIYNVAGSLVKSVKNVSNKLNIGGLSTGMYIVKLEGVAKTFKVVKH